MLALISHNSYLCVNSHYISSLVSTSFFFFLVILLLLSQTKPSLIRSPHKSLPYIWLAFLRSIYFSDLYFPLLTLENLLQRWDTPLALLQLHPQCQSLANTKTSIYTPQPKEGRCTEFSLFWFCLLEIRSFLLSLKKMQWHFPY